MLGSKRPGQGTILADLEDPAGACGVAAWRQPAWPPPSGHRRPVTRGQPRAHTGGNVAAHAGEMRVNLGGDPGRDDFGLPPTDIQIPDDARELDRDVQAYYRELRSLRWRRR